MSEQSVGVHNALQPIIITAGQIGIMRPDIVYALLSDNPH